MAAMVANRKLAAVSAVLPKFTYILPFESDLQDKPPFTSISLFFILQLPDELLKLKLLNDSPSVNSVILMFENIFGILI